MPLSILCVVNVWESRLLTSKNARTRTRTRMRTRTREELACCACGIFQTVLSFIFLAGVTGESPSGLDGAT
jgi:hypothetical protein